MATRTSQLRPYFLKSLGKPKENGGNKIRTLEEIPASATYSHSTQSTEPSSQPDKHKPHTKGPFTCYFCLVDYDWL